MYDNKTFWRRIKPSLSYKSYIRDRIGISKKGEILKAESETAEPLTDFFPNIVKSLIISQGCKQEIFKGNRVFLKLRHFDKDPRTTRERKDPQGKNLWFFVWKLLKIAF